MPTITYTDELPHEGSYLVYFNGIEVPVETIEVHMGINGEEPRAAVNVIPDPILKRLGAEDRIEVVAFYLDAIYPEVQRPGSDPDFRLLFEGEILGWSYTNSANGRMISFECGNFIRILNDLQPGYITGFNSLASSVSNPPNPQEATLVAGPFTFPWNRFFYGFDQEQSQLIRRPYDLIENILNACVGVKEQRFLGSVVATNFFARYMRRTSFINRFVPSPILETEMLQQNGTTGVFPILRAVRENQVIEALIQQAAQIGEASSIWGTIQQMFLRMYYETLAITTSPLVQMDRTPRSSNNGMILGPPSWKVDLKSEEKWKEYEEKYKNKLIQDSNNLIETTALLRDDVKWKKMSEKEQNKWIAEAQTEARKKIEKESAQRPAYPKKPNCLINYITKPQWLFGIAPSCNVIFPSMVEELRFEESYIAQPTRLYLNDGMIAEYFAGNSDMLQAIATMRAGYPDQVQQELEKRYGQNMKGSGDPGVSGKNFLVWPEEFFKGPQAASVPLTKWFTLLFHYINSSESVEQKDAAAALKKIEGAELMGQKGIDTVIASLKKSGDIPQNVTSVAEIKKILQQRENNKDLQRAALRRAYARYEYYRHRSAARSGAVVMAFNPYIIPGFPMIVFDDLASGQHCVGYVVSVTHTLTKEGWSTSISFTHGQELDEFVHEVFDARAGNTPYGVLENMNAAPPNPIEFLREVTQTKSLAEDYFSLLLHQKREYSGIKSAAFDFDQAIQFVLPSGEAYSFSDIMADEAVQKEVARRKAQEQKDEAEIREKLYEKENQVYEALGYNEAASEETPQIAKEAQEIMQLFEQELRAEYEEKRAKEFAEQPTKKLPSDVLSKYVTIRPSRKFSLMFKNYTNAMRFISRPICTLEEYIAFRGKYGTRIGRVEPTDAAQGKGARYYEKILSLKQGPGDPPTFDQNNNMVTPKIADFPDTRADWESRLKAYRNKVIFKQAGWRPEEE